MSGRQTAAAPADLSVKAGSSWEYEDAPLNDNATGPTSPRALSPRQLAGLLLANARRIGLAALALFMLGATLLVVFPAKYTATSLVLIDPREQRITNEQDVLPGIGQDAAALQSVIEIAKSDGFLRPLIERLNVAGDTEISGGQTDIGQLLPRFRARLDVSRRGLTYVVAISFSSSDANKAAYYANAVAEAFVAEQAKTRSAATQQAAEWLNNRLSALREQLTKSEDAVAAFRAQYKLIDAGRDSTLRQVRATELTQQASLAKLRAEEAKTRYDQITRDLKSNVDTSTGSRSELLSALRAQRTQLNDQIAQKRAVLGDRHPDVVISLNQRDQVERQIDTERRQILQAAKSDYETLRAQQKHFEDLLAATESEMVATGQAAVKLQDLQRQVDANRSIYEQFLSRYKTTNEQRSMQPEQTRVVSAATVPVRPNRPSLPILLAGIAAASMIFSVLGVVLYETSGRRLLARTSAKPAAPVEPVVPEQPAAPAPPAPPAPVVAPPAIAEIKRTEPPSPLDLPVWAVVPAGRTNPPQLSAPQIEGSLTDMLEQIALTRGVRGRVVLLLSGNVRQARPAIAEALNSLALGRGMLSFLVQLEPEHPQGVVSLQNRFVQTSTSTVRSTVRSLLQLFAGPSMGAPDKSDIRTEFDIIVVDGTMIRNPADIQNLASYIDYAVFQVSDTQAPDGISETLRALAGNNSIQTGVVVDQAAA
jgi:uncharacterized protein involved in exopolysaccharide biosynthesis